MSVFSNLAGYFICLAIYFVLIVTLAVIVAVYVNRDAKKRGMNATAWTVLAVFFTLIAFIVYLIVRSDKKITEKCPKCGCNIDDRFNICPQCGDQLKNRCPSCGCTLEKGWAVCPNCSVPVPENLRSESTLKQKDKGFVPVLVCAIVIPIIAYAVLFFGIFSMTRSMILESDSQEPYYISNISADSIIGFDAVNWCKKCDDLGKGVYAVVSVNEFDGEYGSYANLLVYCNDGEYDSYVVIGADKFGFNFTPEQNYKISLNTLSDTGTHLSYSYYEFEDEFDANCITFLKDDEEIYVELEYVSDEMYYDSADYENAVTVDISVPSSFIDKYDIGETFYYNDGTYSHYYEYTIESENETLRFDEYTLDGYDCFSITIEDEYGEILAESEKIPIKNSYESQEYYSFYVVEEDGKILIVKSVADELSSAA